MFLMNNARALLPMPMNPYPNFSFPGFPNLQMPPMMPFPLPMNTPPKAGFTVDNLITPPKSLQIEEVKSDKSGSETPTSASNFTSNSPKMRPVVNDSTAKPLIEWMEANMENPYPTRADVRELSRQTGFSSVQIRNWFTNHRRRVKEDYEKRGEKLPWTMRQGPVKPRR
uniref:Homeobox domain-containing protein n=1 Tax=Panagrolaimus sp. JU765 TaxID=591449 RepID=A0AC34Q6M0_9BILA